MGKVFFGLWAFVISLAFMLGYTQAAGEACTSVRDYDRRQACFAEARGQPDQCTSIRNQDRRTMCQVQAKTRRER